MAKIDFVVLHRFFQTHEMTWARVLNKMSHQHCNLSHQIKLRIKRVSCLAWARVATIARETVSTLSISRDLFVVSSLSQLSSDINACFVCPTQCLSQISKNENNQASAHTTQSPVQRHNNNLALNLWRRVSMYVASNPNVSKPLSIFGLRKQTNKLSLLQNFV